MARLALTVAILALLTLVLTPHPANAQSGSILDRVRERASSRAATQTENRANQEVDETVDKSVDCMFNPIECAKKAKPEPEPAPTPGEVGAAPPADTTQWYAEQDGARVGPMPRDQLATMVTSGQVTPSTLVWREGMSQWTQASAVPELGDLLKSVPPPLPPKAGPPPLPGR